MQEVIFPEHLYRYRRIDTDYAWEELDEAINKKRVYLSSATALNDPFDFNPIFRDSTLKDMNQELRERHGKNPIMNRSRVSEICDRSVSRSEFRTSFGKFRPGVSAAKVEVAIARKIGRELSSRARVACFSEVFDSIPMWAHYAGNHSGFCVKYRLDVARLQTH